jgi:methionyl-tRNA synthetase
MITFDDWSKIDMRVGRIKSAEKVPGSDKLYRMAVSFGSEERQIVAGLAQKYSPGELEGKKTVFLFNLEPKKLRGMDSQGMILVANDEEKGFSLIVPEKDVKEGSKLE